MYKIRIELKKAKIQQWSFKFELLETKTSLWMYVCIFKMLKILTKPSFESMRNGDILRSREKDEKRNTMVRVSKNGSVSVDVVAWFDLIPFDFV